MIVYTNINLFTEKFIQLSAIGGDNLSEALHDL